MKQATQNGTTLFASPVLVHCEVAPILRWDGMVDALMRGHTVQLSPASSQYAFEVPLIEDQNIWSGSLRRLQLGASALAHDLPAGR